MSHRKSKFSLTQTGKRDKIVANYQPAIEAALTKHGWSIKVRKKYSDHLWFIEMWHLQSEWSPSDLNVFLVFEYDEMHFSAAIALDKPLEHHTTNWRARLYLKKGWEHELMRFLATLDSIRNDAFRKNVIGPE